MNRRITICYMAILLCSVGCNMADNEEDNIKTTVDAPISADDMHAIQEAEIKQEWIALKERAALKINDNDNQIASLHAKIKKPSRILDYNYQIRVEALAKKNNELKARIEAYEKGQTDWNTFKQELNADIDYIQIELKNIDADIKR